MEDVWKYLHPHTVREILVQALLDAPMFGTRWRWNATRALAVQRRWFDKRVPPQLQRMASEDLVALVFPDQLACLENIVGEREVPEHPLVQQTIHDCLTEAMDIEELEGVIARIISKEVELVCKDLREPSPFSHEIINARPYAFLDPAPLEERRTRAIRVRHTLDPATAKDLGKLTAPPCGWCAKKRGPRPAMPMNSTMCFRNAG
jgi:ATP-dependent Lhr-like helicase